MLSRKTAQPVKFIMSRTEVFESTGPTSATYTKVKMGVTNAGKIAAAEANLMFEAGAFPGSPVTAGGQCIFSPYDIETDIPQIEPPFLDIAPAGMVPTIISHSKGVKCVLIRSNSSFHGPTTVLPSVKTPNRLSTTKFLPWEALLPCTTR